jgi:hypothetical protein
MTQQSSQVDTPTEPLPVLSGTFALYDLPSGGVHVVARFAGEDHERHRDIPPFAVAMARRLLGKIDVPS